jgi:hypothetical protein
MVKRKEIIMKNITVKTKINEVLNLVDFSMFRNRIEEIRPISAEIKASDFKEIFTLAMESETFIDDHNGMEEKLDGFAVLRNGYIVLLMKDIYFCLNELYVLDGKLRLSTMSVAGNIISRNRSLEDAIETYNNELDKTHGYMKEIIHYVIK